MMLRILVLTIIMSFLSVATYAQTPQSDYEIQQSFKSEYADYQRQIENVSSPDTTEALISSIKKFDQKYSQHEELLDKALYPDTYAKRIKNLKESSIKTLSRVKTINNQNQKLEELETQLTSYEQELNQLGQQSDSLKQAIRKSTESEKQLSAMLRKYRKNLEKRDELILTFIDSMVVAYQRMDIEDLQDLNGYEERSRIKSNDALKLLHNISEENIQILEQNAGNLQLDDYMRMAEVNHQYEQMWNRLGDKIFEVYEGDDAETLKTGINNNIRQWNKLLADNTVDAVRAIFEEQQIAVEPFSSDKELYTSLNSFLDRKINQSKENPSKDNYEALQKFQKFWDRVEMEWSDDLVYAGILDKEQLSVLNQKMDSWVQQAQPRSSDILVYFLGGSILLAIALAVMLIREKKNKQPA